MGTPVRDRYPGAIYHVFDHAIGEERLFRADRDRLAYLYALGRTVRHHGWRMYAWCLMSNHLHLMFRTPETNLSEGMHRLKITYAGLYNRWYRRRGALFRSPFQGPALIRPEHLLEVIRYVVLNPVHAGMATHPAEWPWSSYRATVGLDPRPPWLDLEGLLEFFDGAANPDPAVYRRFVEDGIGRRSPDLRAATVRPPRARSAQRGAKGPGARSPRSGGRGSIRPGAPGEVGEAEE